MDVDYIEQLIGLVARSPIDELEVERDGLRVRIAKSAAAQLHPAPPGAVAGVRAVSVPSATPAVTAARHVIRAPLTGIFYQAAAESEPPLVAVGDIVEEGQKVAVIEAMKTFNVLEADRAGRVVEIAISDRASVQSGDVLIVLEEVG